MFEPPGPQRPQRNGVYLTSWVQLPCSVSVFSPFFTRSVALTGSVNTERGGVLAPAGRLTLARTVTTAPPSVLPLSSSAELSLGLASTGPERSAPTPACDHSQSTVASFGSASLTAADTPMVLSAGTSQS